MPGRTRPVEVLMGAALLMRRGVFRDAGGWDEGYTFGGEDIDLCRRIGRRRAVIYHPGVEIVHHGRASSRQRIGHVYAQTATGLVRAMRKAGESPAALFLYKLVFTLDWPPISWLRQAGQYLWRRARGPRHRRGAKCGGARGLGGFLLRGLREFWRA